jgi:nucleoside transporter
MFGLRLRLGLMMFLEYAVWGAWTPILAATLSDRMNATGVQTAAVYAVLTIACIITPFIGGQLVDRYMDSQVFLSIAATITAVAAWMMANQHTIGGVIVWMWVWSLAFAPTLGITNSICFFHLSRHGESEAAQERDFAVIRTAGTVGWIIAAVILTWYLQSKPPVPKGTWGPFEELQLTAIFGVLLAVVALLLPKTPPSKDNPNPWAFVEAFSLFRTVPGFTAFMIISFFASTEFQFFYVLSAPFLGHLGIPHAWLPITKSSSQAAEIISLAVFLPISLRYLGMRKTLVIGTLAWPLRYAIFALEKPLWLVVVSLCFHGIGYAFVYISSQIYVDRVAPKDIRASAQSLLTLITLGIGNLAGTYFCGWLKDYYTVFGPDPQHPGQTIPLSTNWPMVFWVPALISTLCAVAFWFTFIEPKEVAPSSAATENPMVGV